MTRILDHFNLFLLCCLLLEAKCATGHIVTQNNVSVLWLNDFVLQLSSSTCQNYTVSKSEGTEEDVQFPSDEYAVMNGNFVNLTLTKCNGTTSPPVHITLHYPELVKELNCYQTSLWNAACSWIPNTPIQELKFFYVFINESKAEDDSTFRQHFFQVKECTSYILTNDARTGCDLELGGTHIFISFRGRKNQTSVNTFRRAVTSNVRPPALTWNITKTKYKFHINWKYPEFSSDWKIRLNYTMCSELKVENITDNKDSKVLERFSNCPYRLAIKATSIKGDSPWSEDKYFEADPPLYMYAAIFFPLMFAGLVVMLLICFRRKRDTIFPKIPEPRDLLSSIPENNFKCMLDSLYATSKEELCKISFVTEPIYSNMKPLKPPPL